MNRIGIFVRLKRGLLQLAVGGTSSIVTAALATNMLRVASSITLTRLLDAGAFGIVGMITSVATIFQLISDIGVQPFVIRHERGSDRAFLDEIWTLRLIRSLGLTVAMAAASIPVAACLGKPEFAAVLSVWSVSFLIEGLSSMAFATAVRDQKLWRLTGSELGASAFQLFVAIALAIWLRSYWALVCAMLASTTLKTILSYMVFHDSRRRWLLSRERVQEMWAFSRFIAPSSLMSLLILQTDKLLLARLMPLASYGLYAVAASLAGAAPAVAFSYGRRVLYPAYAQAVRTAPETLRTVFYAKRRWANLVFMAALGAVSGGAYLIVAIMYDPRYQSVALYLRLLSVSGALALANISAEEALIAAGNIRATLYANIVRIVWLTLGVCTAVATGKTILLVGAFGLVEIAAMFSYWHNLRKVGLFSFREEAAGLMVACAFAGAAYAVAIIGQPFVHHNAAPPSSH